MSETNPQIKIFTATKAFIIHNGKVLLLRESGKYVDGTNSGRYDVVGGRVEPGQRFDESLLREIKEETGLSVTVGRPFCVNEWRPVVRGEQWQIIGTFFECFTESEEVVLSADHDDYKWIEPKDFRQNSIMENLIPVFESYLELKKQYGP
ncbi:MAG: NUDIX domain-containing protein [Candidatus Magasanikbacteria bacterium]|nr:NUDIX domain-containing protein [Candidatus Magasanikbacteria bacterium]